MARAAQPLAFLQPRFGIAGQHGNSACGGIARGRTRRVFSSFFSFFFFGDDTQPPPGGETYPIRTRTVVGPCNVRGSNQVQSQPGHPRRLRNNWIGAPGMMVEIGMLVDKLRNETVGAGAAGKKMATTRWDNGPCSLLHGPGKDRRGVLVGKRYEDGVCRVLWSGRRPFFVRIFVCFYWTGCCPFTCAPPPSSPALDPLPGPA